MKQLEDCRAIYTDGILYKGPKHYTLQYTTLHNHIVIQWSGTLHYAPLNDTRPHTWKPSLLQKMTIIVIYWLHVGKHCLSSIENNRAVQYPVGQYVVGSL